MQELAQRGAGAPEGELRQPLFLRLVEAADERGQDVRGFEVEVVARPVEVRRHGGDEGGTVLPAVGADLDEAGDLGYRVGLVGGLQRPAQQGVFGDRLGGVPGVDAARSEEQQTADPGLVRARDDAELDAQIVLQELHGVGAVGHDSADLGRRQDDGVGPRRAQIRLGGPGIPQVELRAGTCQYVIALRGQPPGDGGSHQASVARDEDASGCGQQVIHGPDCVSQPDTSTGYFRKYLPLFALDRRRRSG